ncbi:acyl-CoA dehydrogenase family protein [Reyranella sp. CPCC 100927]|uniref:acyl-CoA dehydrogenase family protein n=1 Tax=Reyranella sp. CPCC 100927 TaxID=2599616 RepID=UPI0011B60F88|nr:acyl-CoA dehydrogenase family protein [Reyranella sp. CPCC 100927]TWS99488.1 acyl-CoA dehydrogenase [Reyranella sp. CPCC 100927]
MNEHASRDQRPAPLARAAALAPALAAAADAIERTQRIPEPLLSALHESRLFRMLLPRSVGGDEVEPWVYLGAVEEVARHDGSVAWNIFVGNSSALIAPFVPLATAHTIYADPRTIIAWGPPNSCRAQAAPGGYRVSGRWDFASGCRQANWMGVHCLVEEADGSLRLNRAGRPTMRTLLFPAEQAELLDTWNVIGLRGTASNSYTISDIFVPEAFSGTREDPALRSESGRLYAFTMQGLYAVGVAGVGLGIARAMLDAFVDLATRKAPRNLGRLADSATVQSGVARMEARLGAARAYLTETLSSIWATAGTEAPIDVPARARVRLACTHAIQTAEAVANHAYKAAGTDAIFLGTAFERRFRDMHTLSQQIQSRPSHFEAVGQILLGIEPRGPFL